VAWVEQHLAPELRRGDIVVMDNLSSHKVKGVAEAIESVGAEVRYLPPYSPDLNPIELAFSKFKRLLRDGMRRTQEGLVGLCGTRWTSSTNRRSVTTSDTVDIARRRCSTL
jgi:hypothetical protein